jgi:hypothetical protein
VGQVGSDTERVNDIVERELIDELAGLEEERQWLYELATTLSYNLTHLTCPMPPAAPATTALTIVLSVFTREECCVAEAG